MTKTTEQNRCTFSIKTIERTPLHTTYIIPLWRNTRIMLKTSANGELTQLQQLGKELLVVVHSAETQVRLKVDSKDSQ